MEIALIGLSQSGKSTLFAALASGRVHAGAGAAHQVDKAVIKVDDPRLDKLCEIYRPKKTTYATVDFIDLPGLSFIDEPGRHEARRIIAQARQADMFLIVVCAFHNDSVAVYRDRVEPVRDIEEINNEFLLADLELVENRIEKLKVAIAKPVKNLEQNKKGLALLEKCRQAIEDLKPLSSAVHSPEEEKLLRSFGFLTLKPILIVLNVDEDKINQPPALPPDQADYDVIALSAPLEAELADLDESDREAFLKDMKISDIARNRLIKQCYQNLNVISFLTVVADELRAWTVPAGCSALEAAGHIHSDMQRGFIRAETVAFDDFITVGDMKAAKAAGKVRLEGKNYLVKDGDIIQFRFNV